MFELNRLLLRFFGELFVPSSEYDDARKERLDKSVGSCEQEQPQLSLKRQSQGKASVHEFTAFLIGNHLNLLTFWLRHTLCSVAYDTSGFIK